jgi:tetratricopeptide (TPR) repeat protein
LDSGDVPTDPAPMAAPEEPAPSLATEAAAPPSVAPAAFQESIDAGLKAFIRARFSRARDEFEKAYTADPQSAAAAFYLAYANYKVGEPSARMNADKQKARELFAKAYQLDPAFQPVWGQKKE